MLASTCSISSKGRGELRVEPDRVVAVAGQEFPFGRELDPYGRLIRYRAARPRHPAHARAARDLGAESFGHRRDDVIGVGDRRARPEREFALPARLEPQRSRDDRVAHRSAFRCAGDTAIRLVVHRDRYRFRGNGL
jgi:hypothetical protein